METTQIQNPLEENQEMYIQNSQCEKFVKLSKDMWKNPIKGFAIVILVNFFYIYFWKNKINGITILCYLLICYILFQLFLRNIQSKQ
jgi:hypothetical protein